MPMGIIAPPVPMEPKMEAGPFTWTMEAIYMILIV